MTNRKHVLTTAGLLAALALPAAASAHPGIYETTALVVAPGSPTPATAANLVEQTRYAVGNDGYPGVLRESNGAPAGRGLVNYLLMPSANGYRSSLTPAQKLERGSDVQAHAICIAPPGEGTGAAKLNLTANILAWQQGSTEAGTDPFYNYVPFQRATGGFGDTPAKWIALVKEQTGVDLASVEDTDAARQAACTSIAGTYYAADAVQSTPASFASAVVADAVAPLTTQVGELTTAATGLTGQVDALSSRVATLTAQKTAAEGSAAAAQQVLGLSQAQIAALNAAATPLKLSLNGKPTVRQVQVALVGAPGSVVKVRLMLGEVQAKRLGLRSRVVGTATATLAANGTGTATVKTAAALKKLKRSVPASVDATAGNRYSSLVTTLTR